MKQRAKPDSNEPMSIKFSKQHSLCLFKWTFLRIQLFN